MIVSERITSSAHKRHSVAGRQGLFEETVRPKTCDGVIRPWIRQRHIAKARQTLNIAAADIEVAPDLHIAVNSPVAEVRRVFNNPDGSVLYLGEASYRGDYVHLDCPEAVIALTRMNMLP